MPDPWTELGGAERQFPLTRWTLLGRIREAAAADRRESLNALALAYWKPLYCRLRATGCSNEDAKDAIQGFFEALLERDLVAQFEPAKGRFRTFLAACLQAWMGHARERAAAHKRGGGRARLSLDALESEGAAPAIAPGLTPDEAYARAWAQATLERAVARVRAELEKAGDRPALVVLDGYLASENLARPGYAELCKRSGLRENVVRHHLDRFRRRLRRAMLEEVAVETANEAEAQDELKQLMALLAPR
ncbi:MAG: hypothetical protein HYZ53_10445 [Planctomycetes bacterium]|nr:hypothetical protein [Planctomycetota bacterium]